MELFSPYSEINAQDCLADGANPSLQDVRDWLDGQSCSLALDTRIAYKGAIDRCCRILNKAPGDIVADRRDVLARLPIANYNPSWAKNPDAAKRLLRNLGCAINKALGTKAKKQALRTADDYWQQLISALQDHLRTTQKPVFSEKKLIAVVALADVGRENDIDSHEITTASCLTILMAARDYKHRKFLKDALKFLGFLQSCNSLSLGTALPSAAFEVPSGRLNNVTSIIPIALLSELQVFVAIAAKGSWSVTDHDYVNNSDTGPIEKAVKKVVGTLAVTLEPGLADFASVAEAFDKKHLTICVQTWRKWHQDDDPRALDPSTAKGYIERLAVLLDKNGECSKECRSILKLDLWLNSKKSESSRMPLHIRNFCRRIMMNKSERLRLLAVHVAMRKKAQFHLNQIERLKNSFGPNSDVCRAKYYKQKLDHETKARQYGVCAAFAAIEVGACPVRINNAISITYKGDDRWLDLNAHGSGSGHLFIPGCHVKNKKDISAPILASNKLRPLETLHWYEKNIRPLFHVNRDSNHFFPAIKAENEPMVYHTLKGWWDRIIAEFGFPGMNPHMFRHIQASILVARRPGDWTLVSVRLGDTEATCEAFYAWIDQEGLMLEGQNILAEEFYNAA